MALYRLFNLPTTSWAHKAAMEHLSPTWNSPFYNYIYKIKQKLDITSLYNKQYILNKVEQYSLNILNAEIAQYRNQLPAVKPVIKIFHQEYVTESKTSKLLVGIIYNHYAPFNVKV